MMKKTLPLSPSSFLLVPELAMPVHFSAFSRAPLIRETQSTWGGGSVFSFLEQFLGNQEGPLTQHSSKRSEGGFTAISTAVLGLLPSQVFHSF